MCACHSVYVEVRRQLLWAASLFPLCGSWELNLGLSALAAVAFTFWTTLWTSSFDFFSDCTEQWEQAVSSIVLVARGNMEWPHFWNLRSILNEMPALTQTPEGLIHTGMSPLTATLTWQHENTQPCAPERGPGLQRGFLYNSLWEFPFPFLLLQQSL